MSTPNNEDTWNDVAEAALVIHPGEGKSQTVILDGCNIGLDNIDRPVVSIKTGNVTISPKAESENLIALQPNSSADGDQVGIVTVEPQAALTFAGDGYLRIESNSLSESPILGIRGSNIQFNSGKYDIGSTKCTPAIGDVDGNVSGIVFAGADVHLDVGTDVDGEEASPALGRLRATSRTFL